MDFEQVLNTLEQYSQFFRQPIEIPIEKYSIDPQLPKAETKKTDSKNEKPENKVQTISSTIPVDEAEKDKKKENHRNIVNPSCKCFFALIKPKGAEKGKRVMLLYSPPFIEILDEMQGENPDDPPRFEMEVVPSNAEISYEGRFLYITSNQVEREFTIKSKRDIFENIVTSEFKTPLVPFILSILGCERLPPTPQMTLAFLYKTIYTDSFLRSFNYLSPDLLVSADPDEDILKSWVQASDPILDAIISKLFREFFQEHNWEEDFDVLKEFPFKVAGKIMEMDADFEKFVTKMSNAVSDKVESYLSGLEGMPFNQRTLMLLHLIYDEANKRFPDSQAPGRMVSDAIFKAALLPSVAQKKPSQDLSDLNNIISFSQTAVCLDQLKRYEQILRVFRHQPRDYEPVKRGQTTFEAFLKLLALVGEHPSEFLNVARRLDQISA